MSGGSLTAQPLNSAAPQFNWVFLVELIVCGILTLFFLFYFNRLFATLVSYGIRAYTWHCYQVYIDIHALQISLLGGRIFFKGFRYHGENETILVQAGYLTWRYWLRSTRKVDSSRTGHPPSSTLSAHKSGSGEGENKSRSQSGSGGERGGIKEASQLPCRIEVTLHGLEWFVYNRSPAYDAIRSGFGYTPSVGDDGLENREESHSHKSKNPYNSDQNQDGPPTSVEATPSQEEHSRSSLDPDTFPVSEVTDPLSPRGLSASESRYLAIRNGSDNAPISKFLAFLPVWMVCHKGAMVVGNENTTSVLTTTFDKATGQIDASNAGPFDIYRQVFEFDLIHPVVQMLPNPDFKQSQLAAAKGLGSVNNNDKGPPRKRDLQWKYWRHRRKIWHSICDLIPYFQRSVESFHINPGDDRVEGSASPMRSSLPGEGRWLGLTRYLDEDDRREHEGWSAIEYGRFSTLLDCHSLTLTYYWDVAGRIPICQTNAEASLTRTPNAINGTEPPEWGLHLSIRGGTVNYGPWADRERVCLQNIFLPNPYRDATPAKPLAPRQLRQSTVFKLTIDIEQDISLRIPIREASKDWLWKGRAEAVRSAGKLKRQKEKKHPRSKEAEKKSQGPDIRPFGWLSLRIDANSTIKYTVDMVASTLGYRNKLDLDLYGSRMTSSVNHGLLWKSGHQTISCDLSNPLGWNTLHTWAFEVESRDLDLYMLRDHTFLLTDLINDWSSGGSSDFYTFVPFQYEIRLSFVNFRLLMNVNDSNIINNPSDADDNAFLVIRGDNLVSRLGIPMSKYKPNQNSITFDVVLSNGRMELLTPLWNTQHTFLRDQTIAWLKDMTLNGSFTYNLATSPTLTDTLLLNITGVCPKLCLYGFLIRYFLKIKENYFGEHQHFRTLEEFQVALTSAEPSTKNNNTNLLPKSNDMDVILHINAESASILLPANIYDRRKGLELNATSLIVDVRFTNYYMDLETSFSPLEIVLESLHPDGSTNVSNPQLFIDGIRIYGHRLFGLPPTEPTYVCNWDFQVGQIIGECSSDFLRHAGSSLKFFAFSLGDEENALPPLHPIALHDVTFLRAKTGTVRIWVLVDEAALLLSSGAASLDFNDWAGSKFSECLNLSIPGLTFAAVDQKSASRLRGESHHPVKTYAYFETAVDFKMVKRKSDFAANRSLQQQYVRTHDQRSHRTPWLLGNWDHGETDVEYPIGIKVNPPAMAIPRMPEPINDLFNSNQSSYSTVLSSSSFRNFPGHKRSFFSFRSSDSSRVGAGKARYLKQRPFSATLSDQTSRAPNEDMKNFRSRTTMSLNSPKDRVSQHLLPGDHAPEESWTSARRVSSRWGRPYFHYYKIDPDVTDVPSLPPIINSRERDTTNHDGEIELPPGPEYDKTTQVYSLCAFDSGLKGFCSPDFLYALSSFLDGFQSLHPVDIIDNLQSSVISDILGHNKPTSKSKRISNFYLRLPVARIRLISSSASLGESLGRFKDQYDTSLSEINVMFRMRNETKDMDCASQSLAGLTVHISAKSITVSAQGEEVDALNQKGVLQCRFDNTIFWLVSGSTVRAHLQVQNIEAVTSNKSVEDVACLLRRTTKLVDSVATPFRQQSERRTKRLRYLVYCLTQYGTETADPLFLTRPSYVLRAAGEHLRLNDSWKIISRFRNIYQSLPSDRIKKITTDCLCDDVPCPADARSTVLSSFEKWRSWDLAHVKKSHVMRTIWGSHETENSKIYRSPVEMSLFVTSIRFSLDPGPKENGLFLENFTASISVNRRLSALDASTRLTTVQTRCSNVSLLLKWEICELIEGILKSIPKVVTESYTPSEIPQDKKRLEQKVEGFHIVAVADTGSIVLDGINLKLTLLGNNLQGSIIRQPSETVSSNITSVVIAADASSAEFTSRSKTIMGWRLWHPNVYLYRSSRESDSHIDRDWKIAAVCKTLRYEMKEDPLGIVQVVDRIVEDEVKYALDLIAALHSPTLEEAKQSVPGQHVYNRFHVATFLDDYQINLSLLPSLTYLILGKVARLSIAPGEASKFELDFDIEHNSHTFRSGTEGQRRIISTLGIPPINGRVLVDLSPSSTVLEIGSTVELMKVEASAVRNLLGAISRPEMSHLVSDLIHDTQVLKHHIDQVFSRGQPAVCMKSDKQNRDLVYKLALVLAGISVHSSAPALSTKDYSADMNLNLGTTRIHLENGSLQTPAFEYPDFHIQLYQVALDLKKRDKSQVYSYGNVVCNARISGSSRTNEKGDIVRAYHLASAGLEVELFAETASMIVDIAAHLQQRIKTLDLSQEVKHLRKLRLIRSPEKKRTVPVPVIEVEDQANAKSLFDAMYSVELIDIQVSWIICNPIQISCGREPEDLVLSVRKIDLSTKEENAARLRIEDMQLQMIPKTGDKRKRSQNSALLPEVVFNVAYLSTNNVRRLAFQAAGKALDIRMTSEFILPASLLQGSIASASEKLREANMLWTANVPPEHKDKQIHPTSNRLASLLIDADFAGAVISLQGRQQDEQQSAISANAKSNRASGGGKYGQYAEQGSTTTATLRAPGVALKVQFEDTGAEDPALNAEIKVAGSTNVLYPTVVPLIMQISSSVTEVVGEPDSSNAEGSKLFSPKVVQGKPIDGNGPTTILGRCKLNIGLWICRQEFTLSCQPIARVAATACFEGCYITVNTVQPAEHRRFFAVLVAFHSLQASVKHVYSSESTASFDVNSVVMSMMNSKHVSSSSGISAILKISPTQVQLNAKEVQDFLLFREIWVPQDDSPNQSAITQSLSHEAQTYMVQRYQQVAAAGAFPWNSTLAIEELSFQVDLGQTLGKSVLTIKNLWLSSKKSSDWEQNLCIGFEAIAIESKGRLSGFVELSSFRVRTSIQWPDEEPSSDQTPLIQASIGFTQLQAKVSFEYQPFLIADVTSFEFLMYNVRDASKSEKDRLVSSLEGDKVQVFCTALTAAQGLALYQTIQRLAQDKQTAYTASLKEIEKFLWRKSAAFTEEPAQHTVESAYQVDSTDTNMPISLHTDVVVSLQAVNIGAFPSTFYDNQIFKLEALGSEARFSVRAQGERIHSGLGLTLGELRVALSAVSRPGESRAGESASEELSVNDVVTRATGSRSGTILKVPRVLASMETWQTPMSNHIDYTFESSFEGKVDVGWNYARISFIRGMWTNHSRALASRLGKPLPKPAVKITGGPGEEGGEHKSQEKITAVVNVPQSKYSYTAMNPPVIETPQLRDMGEATPPLEWIGLHRDKLPNITHQIIIVPLTEIAKDVEDAYSKILGSS